MAITNCIVYWDYSREAIIKPDIYPWILYFFVFLPIRGSPVDHSEDQRSQPYPNYQMSHPQEPLH